MKQMLTVLCKVARQQDLQSWKFKYKLYYWVGIGSIIDSFLKGTAYFCPFESPSPKVNVP